MDANVRAVVAGGILTTLTTMSLFLFFDLTQSPLTGDPLSQLRLFGAIPGALVAGYLAKLDVTAVDTENGLSMRVGLYAALVGLVIALVATVLYNWGSAMFVYQMFPPPLLLSTFGTLIVFLPLILLYPFEGLVFGWVGGVLKPT